jgi:hypothetical protein
VTTFTVAEATATCQSPPVRGVIYLRKYEFPDTPEFKGAFQQFRDAFQKEAWRIPGKIAPEHLRNKEILRPSFDPSLDQAPDPFDFKDFDDVLIWLRNSGKDAIALVHGQLQQSDRVDVSTKFFLGELSGGVQDEMVSEVDESSVQKLLDNHNLIVSFALTIDAELRGCDDSMVYSMLVGASEYAKQLRQSNNLDGDALVISQAIDQRIANLRQRLGSKGGP